MSTVLSAPSAVRLPWSKASLKKDIFGCVLHITRDTRVQSGQEKRVTPDRGMCADRKTQWARSGTRES